MLKHLLVLAGICSIAITPVYAQPIQNSLWETVQASQTKDMPVGLAGAWQEDITVKGSTQVSFSDISPFSALQIMLRLESINMKSPLPGYAQVKANFKPFMDYYLSHRLQGEPFGSIGFWPVWTLEDGTVARLPAADPDLLKFLGGSLPADTDDSSQMAIWLFKTDPQHSYIAAYLKMLENVRDADRAKQSDREDRWKQVNSGAFLTWIGNVPSEINNVDCVVNVNILTSLALIKQKVPLSATLQQAEQQTTTLVYDALMNKKFPQCSYYYSRWSHYYLALGKLYEAGGGQLTSEQWQNIRLAYKSQLLSSWHDQKHQTTLEWAELLVAAKMLGLSTDPDLQTVLSEIRQYLQQKIQQENYDELIEGNDVFRGEIRPGMFLLWYVKAQTEATLMEALDTGD